MSTIPLAHLATGHPEIDREHSVLLDLLQQIDYVCVLPTRPSPGCADCSTTQRQICEMSLVDVLSRVLGFTVDHFAFEEKAMRCIPKSPARSEHCEAHIDEHERISRDLMHLTFSIESSDIVRSGAELQAIILGWLTEHMLNVDVPFVALLNSAI